MMAPGGYPERTGKGKEADRKTHPIEVNAREIEVNACEIEVNARSVEVKGVFS